MSVRPNPHGTVCGQSWPCYRPNPAIRPAEPTRHGVRAVPSASNRTACPSKPIRHSVWALPSSPNWTIRPPEPARHGARSSPRRAIYHEPDCSPCLHPQDTVHGQSRPSIHPEPNRLSTCPGRAIRHKPDRQFARTHKARSASSPNHPQPDSSSPELAQHDAKAVPSALNRTVCQSELARHAEHASLGNAIRPEQDHPSARTHTAW